MRKFLPVLIAAFGFICSMPSIGQQSMQGLVIETAPADGSRCTTGSSQVRNSNPTTPLMGTIRITVKTRFANGIETDVIPFTGPSQGVPIVPERPVNYLGIFLKPGEVQRIGCQSIAWPAASPNQISGETFFAYNIVGAYSPTGVVANDAVETPERYLKYQFEPGASAVCGTESFSVTPLNFHPTRTMFVEYEITAPPSNTVRWSITSTIPPLTLGHIFPCYKTGDRTWIKQLKFVSEPMSR